MGIAQRYLIIFLKIPIWLTPKAQQWWASTEYQKALGSAVWLLNFTYTCVYLIWVRVKRKFNCVKKVWPC